MKALLMIAFTMIFTENYVLVQFIAICPFLGVSQKLDSSLGMSGAVIFVMTLASAATYCIYRSLMVPLGLEYLSTIIFILVIAALVQFVEIFLKKFVRPLYSALGIYLPLITTNCAVLAVTLLNVTNGYADASVSYGWSPASTAAPRASAVDSRSCWSAACAARSSAPSRPGAGAGCRSLSSPPR